MPSIRQKLRIRAKCELSGIQRNDESWIPACCWHLVYTLGKVRYKQDGCIAAPASAPIIWGWSDDNNRPSRCIDGLQHPIRKKTKGTAIRRPEWIARPICPGQRMGRQRVQGANPKLRCPGLAHCTESHCVSVGTERGRTAI